jgi:hypothetical protein
MTPEQLPPDALFIRWGRFHAGASGRVAWIAVIGIIAAILIWALVRL